MKTAASLLACLALTTLAPATASADEDGRLAVSGSIGSMGGAVELRGRLNDYVTVRGGANYFEYGTDVEVDDIDYDADLEFSGAGLFADLHPFANSFVVSGGAFFGGKEIGLETSPDESVEIGGIVFTPAEYGRLEGTTEFDDVVPYLGIGIDTSFTGSGNWGYSLMAGAAFLGSGKVTLDSVGGTLSDDPLLQQELSAEALKIQKEIEDYDVWPVVQVGLSYRF